MREQKKCGEFCLFFLRNSASAVFENFVGDALRNLIDRIDLMTILTAILIFLQQRTNSFLETKQNKDQQDTNGNFCSKEYRTM